MGDKPPEEEGVDSPTFVKMMSGPAGLVGIILGGRYEILEVIGEGGIGIVYRARQLTVDRDVAIKILRKQYAHDDLAVRRFENEANAISRLRHPNTLRLYDCQRTPEGDLYLVTELLSGSPLSDVLKKEMRLPIDRAVRTLDEVCRSLAEAHAAGVVHRDLKPANIFVDRIGNEDVVKVLDFGIAKILSGSTITRAGAVPGTPHYMSPEQATGARVDHRVDIYALGVIFYQMIAGVPPFDAPSVVEILQKHITAPPPRFADAAPHVAVPPELERLIGWMLAKAPEDRPQTVDEIRNYLPGILAITAPVRPLMFTPESKGVHLTTGESPPVQIEEGTEETRTDPLPDFNRLRSAKPRKSKVRTLSQRFSDVSKLARWRAFTIIAGATGVVIGIVVGYASVKQRVIIEGRADRRAAELDGARGVSSNANTRVATVAVSLSSEDTRDRGVVLRSEPPGAVVIAPDGTRLGFTPLTISSEEPATYVLVGGGKSSSVLIDPERDAGRTVRVTLRDAFSSDTGASPPRKHRMVSKHRSRLKLQRSHSSSPIQ
jgi:serine/threonine protein kinase